MQESLKNKLEKLNERFQNDADIITLKVFCSLPETEENWNTIKLLLQNIIKKYPNNEEILDLLPKYEINYDKLKEYLKSTYPEEIEVKILEELLIYSNNKKDIFTKTLKRLIKKYSNDEEILKALKLKKYIKPDLEDNMIVVEGKDEYEIMDLYVGKFPITQEQWVKLMGNHKIYYGKFFASVAMDRIEWLEALEFCNKLSEQHNFQPVYKIENNKLVKILYKNGEEVNPNVADFEKTEGYRLPTVKEWEWFASGGNLSKEKTEFAGSNYINSVAWYYKNSGDHPHSVGQKVQNELNLYDCSGNVAEWCYDTPKKENFKSLHTRYIYDEIKNFLF